MKLSRVSFPVGRMTAWVALALLAGVAVILPNCTPICEVTPEQQCRNHLHQLAIGLQCYVRDYGSFPAGTVPNDRLPPERRLSWLVAASRQMDWDWPFDLSQPRDSDANRVMEFSRVNVLTCPTARTKADEHMPGRTWYVGIAGVGLDAPALPRGHPRAGAFGYDRRTRPEEVRDGASNTLLLAETGRDNGPWAAGGPATVRGLDPSRLPYIGPGRQFGGLHRGGVYVAFVDGSARFVSDTIHPRVYEALSTVAGGEALPAGWER